MKQTFTLILLTCFIIADAQEDILKETSRLIEKKKYETAYNLLDKADPANENPDMVIAKTDLVLNYFVTSLMHQMFALKDLEAGETIPELRGNNGKYSLFAFAPDSALSELIVRYPDNYKLQKSLGSFYHEVHLKYPGCWLESDSVIVGRYLHNYLAAYNKGVYDYWSAYGIAYAYLMNQDYEAAIPYLLKSTELKDDYPSSHYNLAYAYLFTNRNDKGIESAKKAMALYDYPPFKADAARMIALMHRETGNTEDAYNYYLEANSIEPGNYYSIKPLLEMEVELGKKDYQNTIKQFFLLDPGNPAIYQDLVNIFMSNDKGEELLGFFLSQHDHYKGNNKINGNLYLYQAVIEYAMGEAGDSTSDFEKARNIFKEVFEPGHDVFKMIDSYMMEEEVRDER